MTSPKSNIDVKLNQSQRDSRTPSTINYPQPIRMVLNSRAATMLQKLSVDTPEAIKQQSEVFAHMDSNCNNMLSVAEIEAYIHDEWPEFDKQRMIIRAHHAADTDSSGYITRSEFKKFLKYLLFFEELYEEFMMIDKDHDNRLSLAEFVEGCRVIGGAKIQDPVAAFHAMDRNQGGWVLFDEFSVWIARKMHVDNVVDEETYQDAYYGAYKVLQQADGHKVRSGPWWKGRMKLKAMTKKNDPKAKSDRAALFRRLDRNNDQSISMDEFFRGVCRMWPEFDSMHSVTLAFHAADRSGDGTLQPSEFRLVLLYLIHYDDAWEGFKQMDTNTDGKLSLAEFQTGIHLLNLRRNIEDVTATFHTMKTDATNCVHLDEFAVWLAVHHGMGDAMVTDTRRSMCLLRNERANTNTSTATLYSFLKMLDFEAYEELLERAGYSNVAKLQEANMLTLRNSGLTIGAARRMMAAARMAT